MDITKNVFNTQENNHLWYSLEKIFFTLELQVFFHCHLGKDLTLIWGGGQFYPLCITVSGNILASGNISLRLFMYETISLKL